MKRREDESYEDYKERRAAESKRVKRHLKGRLIWDSKKQGPARSIKRINKRRENGKQA